MIEKCHDDLVARTLTKQDIEGFLSSFVYNQHGGTDIKKVAPLVFEKDPYEFTKLANVLGRPNPPPAVINQELANRSSDGADVSAKRLRELLVEIEDKSFESKPIKFKSFREMDLDGDGYISYKDF